MTRFSYPQQLAEAIAQGAGDAPADVVLKGGQVYDLVTGALRPSDVAICGARIVGVDAAYAGTHEIDVSGKVLVPGFIDAHLHVESSLVTPQEFERCVLPHGVTTAICDPHEIANVLGDAGIQYFLSSSLNMIMDLKVMLPSCVPATHLETSGARLEAGDLKRLAEHRQVLGLAEFMNFPGVLARDAYVLDKLATFQNRHIDGHAPLLTGKRLNGYLSAGISTDHETTTAAEALEKLAKGMVILVREGSVSKDLAALAPIISDVTAPFMAFCTDDRNPLDIAEEGHIDHLIRTAIKSGAPVLAAYRMASISAARAFGLTDRGLIAPGYRADIAVLDDLADCRVAKVMSAGRMVDEALMASRRIIAPVGRNSIKAARITAADLVARGQGPSTAVIGVMQGKIITEHLTMSLPFTEGVRSADLAQDALKVAVVARHGINRNIGVGFVHGFGLAAGAIASSVGHDSHNICVVGANDDDMAIAANRLGEIEGGFAVVRDGKVLAEMALPVAGLMSLLPFETVHGALLALRSAARGLGCTLAEPFLQVAFLPLPVIPHLKITDMGVVDVDRFELVRD